MDHCLQCPFIHCLTPVYICQHVLLASSLLMLCYLMFCKYELPATITVHVNLLVLTASSICWGCWYLPTGITNCSGVSARAVNQSSRFHYCQQLKVWKISSYWYNQPKVRSFSCSLFRVEFEVLKLLWMLAFQELNHMKNTFEFYYLYSPFWNHKNIQEIQ